MSEANTKTLSMSDKTVFRIVMALSVAVFIAVVVLNRRILPEPSSIPGFVSFLPKLNAIINGTCSVLLLASLYYIKKKDIATHRKINIIAFFLSAIFLVSYVLFHYFHKETTFGGEGAVRGIYYFILITHIVLAAIVLPLVLLSFYWGLRNDVKRHRRLTRWSWPIWFYITVSGVVVYLMISPYYSF
jgi:putative membrane protein